VIIGSWVVSRGIIKRPSLQIVDTKKLCIFQLLKAWCMWALEIPKQVTHGGGARCHRMMHAGQILPFQMHWKAADGRALADRFKAKDAIDSLRRGEISSANIVLILIYQFIFILW
jgi:hypothetical protein